MHCLNWPPACLAQQVPLAPLLPPLATPCPPCPPPPSSSPPRLLLLRCRRRAVPATAPVTAAACLDRRRQPLATERAQLALPLRLAGGQAREEAPQPRALLLHLIHARAVHEDGRAHVGQRACLAHHRQQGAGVVQVPLLACVCMGGV